MSYTNTNYPYYHPNGYSYQGYPTSVYQYSSSVSTSRPYPISTPMIPNTSQDSYTSSSSGDSRRSSNTYSSYGSSPSAYSPTETPSFNTYTKYPASSTSTYQTTLAPSQPIPPTQHTTPTKGERSKYVPSIRSISLLHPHRLSSSFPPIHLSPIPPPPPSAHPSNLSNENRSKKETPFICLHPSCPRAFARSYDLNRHVQTHFPAAAPRYDCPKGGPGGFCGRVGEKAFTRKDHLDEHLRKVHMMDIPKSARGSRS